MRRVRVVLLAIAVALGSVFVSTPPAAAHPPLTYYLSLGDSLAVGYQPEFERADGTTSPAGPTGDGYPNQLYDVLKQTQPSLELIQIGCPGETTATMIEPNPQRQLCIYGGPGGISQLDRAKQILADPQYRGKITHLTIDIGANDVIGVCFDSEQLELRPGCAPQQIQTVRENLSRILLELNVERRTTKASGMTYYNPLLALYPIKPDVARRSAAITNAFNVTPAATYVTKGFRVAPVGLAFESNNFAVTATSAPLPVNVAKICALTWMCALNNIHANKAGYKLIADTFAQTFRWR